MPDVIIPDWPDTGFRQLSKEHRPFFPKVTAEQLQSYYIYRLASDQIANDDIKAIQKGDKLFEGKRVKSCSVHRTQQDLYITGIVTASMKKKVFVKHSPSCEIHVNFHCTVIISVDILNLL